ncbi:hypothetical protein OC844_002680 [Tilletia horrida]|nr:hypothetical protein OC844_002680 [Tilletia horrida]
MLIPIPFSQLARRLVNRLEIMVATFQLDLTPGNLFRVSAAILCLLGVTKVLFAIHAFIFAPRRVSHLPGTGVQHWFFGTWDHSPLMRGTFVHRLQELIDRHGRIAHFVEVGRKPAIVVADHAAFTHVLLKEAMPKAPRSIRIIRRHIGRGLLGEMGDVHRRQRKVASPAFSQEAVEAMSRTIIRLADRLVDNIDKLIAPGETPLLNMSAHWTKYTLDVIGRVGFDFDFGALTDAQCTPLEAAYSRMNGLLATGTLFATLRLEYDIMEPLGRLLGIKEQLELDASKKVVDEIGRTLIAKARARYERMHEGKTGVEDDAAEDEDGMYGQDLLSLMTLSNMDSDLKPSQRLSDAELSAMLPTIIIAGHETTAHSLAWASYALTRHGHGLEVQKRLRDELRESDGSWRAGAGAIDELVYLDAVAREVLRLHSPIRFMGRRCPADTWLPLDRPILQNGTLTTRVFVPKDVLLVLHLHHMNTDPEVWGPDGRSFRPERWLPETHEHARLAGAPDASTPPPHVKAVWSSLASFGMGRASCIGRRVAVTEFKIGLAAMLSSFELLPASDTPGAGPEIGYLSPITSQPIVLGEEAAGTQMPVRLRRL